MLGQNIFMKAVIKADDGRDIPMIKSEVAYYKEIYDEGGLEELLKHL